MFYVFVYSLRGHHLYDIVSALTCMHHIGPSFIHKIADIFNITTNPQSLDGFKLSIHNLTYIQYYMSFKIYKKNIFFLMLIKRDETILLYLKIYIFLAFVTFSGTISTNEN